MANPEHLEIIKQGVSAWNKWRGENPLVRPDLLYADIGAADLSGADLHQATLVAANFSGANLSGANLSGVHLSRAILTGADLRKANLVGANFMWTNLAGANLRAAHLVAANFRESFLEGTDFNGALVGRNSFGETDLSRATGLEHVRHIFPSSIGIDTIYSSQGDIPEAFLRGCGVPEPFIVQIAALVAALEPIQFYSCFISYSSADRAFAERLHADLQAKGVRVWFAPHDMKIGARLRPTIDESIRIYDKLLLVLSEYSVSSQWVEQEVETALAKEREPEGKTVLFPVRIDDAVMESKAGWPALLKNTRNVGDFTLWKDHESYQKAFDRLLRDLKAEA
jgi:uncharacterized protein YjbI with pentapeptide repeats